MTTGVGHKATEAVAKLRTREARGADEQRKILHAIEGLAGSWKKVHARGESATDFDKGRQQQSAYAISLLLGVGQRQVVEALENGWI